MEASLSVLAEEDGTNDFHTGAVCRLPSLTYPQLNEMKTYYVKNLQESGG